MYKKFETVSTSTPSTMGCTVSSCAFMAMIMTVGMLGALILFL